MARRWKETTGTSPSTTNFLHPCCTHWHNGPFATLVSSFSFPRYCYLPVLQSLLHIIRSLFTVCSTQRQGLCRFHFERCRQERLFVVFQECQICAVCLLFQRGENYVSSNLWWQTGVSRWVALPSFPTTCTSTSVSHLQPSDATET